MRSKPIKILFLCTGNSARSIMAEAILNKIGYPQYSAESAGSHPTGTVNPLAIELLGALAFPTSHLRSKSWTEFTSPTSSNFDVVITVCDRAAAESCPVWPGNPVKGHWSLPDPASSEGSHANQLDAFRNVYQELKGYIRQLVQFPPGPLDREDLQLHLDSINKEKTQLGKAGH